MVDIRLPGRQPGRGRLPSTMVRPQSVLSLLVTSLPVCDGPFTFGIDSTVGLAQLHKDPTNKVECPIMFVTGTVSPQVPVPWEAVQGGSALGVARSLPRDQRWVPWGT